MILNISAEAVPDNHKAVFSFRMACLLAVFLTAAAGCASAPLYMTHAELPQRMNAIKTVGLLPPLVAMSEEQYSFGLNKVIPRDDWSGEATDALRKAFIDEAAAHRLLLTVVDREDRETNDILDLFSAVDISIQKHAYESKPGAFPPREPFPEKVRSFDYSLGPAREMMERHGVDAVWIVAGFNLLPTAGAQLGDAGAVLLSIFAAMGGATVPALVLVKIELRAALVDKEGTILFYCKLNEEDIPAAAQNPGQFNISQGANNTGQAAAENPREKDIRDPRTARRYVRALLSEYRKAVEQ